MNIVHDLLEANWAILPESRRALAEQLRQAEQAHALMARDAVPVEGTNGVTMRGDVAILHVKGPLFRYRSWITSYLGTCTYGELRKDLQSIVDAGAKALLTVFDSPGGEVNGCAELADAFYAARAKIPNMAAYASGTCASAAYFLGSAVGNLIVAPTSVLGSIGVITTLVDYSGMDEQLGIKEHELTSKQSPKKSQQPSDPAYRARVQQRLDDLAAVFIARVAQYRGVSETTVQKQYGQGDVMVGQRAVDAGLADSLGDVESAIASLQAQVNRATAVSVPFQMKGPNMDLKAIAKVLKIDDGATEREIEERAHALIGFERDALQATGEKTADEAIGAMHAGKKALGELATVRAEREAEQVARTQTDFRAMLKAAFDSGRVTLGDAAFVASLLNDKAIEKVQPALAALKDQTVDAVLDALCAGPVSPKAILRVQGWATKQAVSVPPPRSEPAPTDVNRSQVASESATQLTAEVSKRIVGNPVLGMSAEELAKYGNITSEADLKRPAVAK